MASKLDPSKADSTIDRVTLDFFDMSKLRKFESKLPRDLVKPYRAMLNSVLYEDTN